MFWGYTSSALLRIVQLFSKSSFQFTTLPILHVAPLTRILGNLISARMQNVKWYFLVVLVCSACNAGEGDHFPPMRIGHLGFLFCDLPTYILCQIFSLVVCLFSYLFVGLIALLLGDSVLLGTSKGRENNLSLDCYKLKPNHHFPQDRENFRFFSSRRI